jgi:signal peptidase I
MFKFYRNWVSRLHPRWQYLIKEWVEPILLAVILALVIRTFFLQAFKIPTGSMRPTLIENDRVLVNKILYDYKEPKHGDIIVFRYPVDGKKDFIKRLVGLPGDTIEIRQGKVLINDEPLPKDSPMRKYYYYNREDWEYGKENMKIKVPANSYFVLGDNSAQSSDSRNWGFVPKSNLIGKAFMIYWPPKRIRFAE